MGLISGRYDLSIDEIMAANGMSNPNLLYVGQELIIPSAEGEAEVIEEAPEAVESGG